MPKATVALRADTQAQLHEYGVWFRVDLGLRRCRHTDRSSASRRSWSARLGTTKDARKIGRKLFPVHRKATVWFSARQTFHLPAAIRSRPGQRVSRSECEKLAVRRPGGKEFRFIAGRQPIPALPAEVIDPDVLFTVLDHR